MALITYYYFFVNEGVYGESDRDKRSLPTVQHGRPQDQFVVTTALGSNANCPSPTREPLGINGIRVVMYLFYLFIENSNRLLSTACRGRSSQTHLETAAKRDANPLLSRFLSSWRSRCH